ncbi:MAG: type II toxin-antitoxin system MqsA family antitoxin [Vicinamibacterales bacterium]|nr:type II toxin-antitoxin system MqsA family antitoxin [Vicinamibacterales bacterium]
MSDPLHVDPLTTAQSEQDTADRDAKIESLLMAGLDHYFASDYSQAIDVWTRALFLDRSHARARAYIERARSALGEQQREAEELIHNGVAAFERGEMQAARQLLNAAVQRGGAHEVALAFLTRIDRISAAPAPAPNAPVAPSAVGPARPFAQPAAKRREVLLPLLCVGAILAIGGYALASWDRVRVLLPEIAIRTAPESGVMPASVLQEPIAVPRGSEAALDRARALFASGRLYDAIRAVDLVRVTDPLRPEADKLKTAIQRELLAYAQVPAARTPSAP